MELCRSWTGQGCLCEVVGMEPDLVHDDLEPGDLLGVEEDDDLD